MPTILGQRNNMVEMTYSIDLKNRVISAYVTRKLLTFRSVQNIFSVSKSTVQRWVYSHPATKHHNRTFVSKYSTARDCIEDFITCNPFCTATDVMSHVKRQLGLSPSQSTISRNIRSLGFTRKKPDITIVNNDTPVLQDKRRVFSQSVQNIDYDTVVSIDESSFCTGFKPKGYAKRGKKLRVCSGTKTYHDRMTLILAVSSSGIVGWDLFRGSGCTDIFADFINKVQFGNYKYALIDNVSFHHAKVVRTAFADKKVVPLYLPPYTPQWQPVEYVFSRLKREYRSLASHGHGLGDRVIASICIVGSSEYSFTNTFQMCWNLAKAGCLVKA
jgi:transposase